MTEFPSASDPVRPVVPEAALAEAATMPLIMTAAGTVNARPFSARRGAGWLRRLALMLALALLLTFALRNAPLEDIWASLSRLHPSQITILLAVDLMIYGLVTARWWFVVHALDRRVGYRPLIAVRLSVFAVSYFTFGPQVGGEPLQVFYLHRKHGLSYTRGASSVVMDKLFEVLANFVLLAFGLIALLRSGILMGAGALTYVGFVALSILAAWPFAHIALLSRRVYPVSAVIRSLAPKMTHTKTARFVRASEHLAGKFCREHSRAMLASLLVSLLAAAATVSEYALITSFLHVGLPFWQTVTAWTAGWLAFLVPLPGGLGALEASQVYALGFFGISAASAISVTLLMRGRDLLIGGLGLLFAGNSARKA